MKRGTLVGVILSALWVVGVCALLYAKRHSLPNLPINEWGDFFAGAVAPLAFFWLVLGYFQQGEELRLNTEALKSQQEELRRQVQETAALVAHTDRQAAASEQLALATMSEAKRAELREIEEAQPLFRPSGGSGTGRNVVLNLVNQGATVFRLSVECKVAAVAKLHPPLQFQSGQTGSITFEGMPDFPFQFSITYDDRLNVQRTKTFEMLEPFQFIEVRGV